MGTVGLNFGAVNSGQGIDVASTVSQIMAAEQAIEDPWKSQLSTLQAQDTMLSQMGSDLSTLATALQKLTDFNGVLAGKQGSSSNEDVVSISSASSLAAAGSHTIVVNQLAQTSSQYSDQITNTSDTLSGTVTIKIGTNTSSLDVNGMTLSDLAAAINSNAMGVRAAVITEANGSRLSLVSSTSGAAGEITMGGSLVDDANGSAVNFQEGTAGQDASLVVDGLSTTSPSNTVTGLIPGVTFQILSKSSNVNDPVQLQIVTNSGAVQQAMSDFVNAYNQVVDDVQSEEGKDANGNAMPLYGDPTLALIQNQLSQGLLSGVASGSIKGLSQLGVTLDKTGHLSFNGDTLDSVINSNFSDVEGFLQNTGSFGQNFTSTLNGLSSTSTTGAIYLALQQNSSQEDTLNENISNQEDRIANDKARLTDQLNTANAILQSIPSQLNEIAQLYSAVTGYNQKS
ncbi:MAG TPA: flagellar filament capping protein FliD [Edaphobacter sp.]